MRCPSCGHEMPDTFKYCGDCGSAMSKKLQDSGSFSRFLTGSGRFELLEERREVTILFADVKGFTAMCERLDPETVRAIMNECFQGLTEAIKEQGGHVDKYVGDQVMAVFGAPMAHEDDPVRACRASLAMQSFLNEFAERFRSKTDEPMRMRIGINSGMVVAGGVGSEARRDYTVMGDPVNVAARLEAAAPSGTVLVSREIVRQVGDSFEFGPPQFLSLKGKGSHVEAYELIRERPQPVSRRRHRDMAVIGREAEVSQLIAQWEAASGPNSWIEIRGETGVGKSVLVREAARRRRQRRLLTIIATERADSRPFGLMRLVLYAVLRDVTGQKERPDSREEFDRALMSLGTDLAPFADVLWHLVAPTRLAVPAPDPDPQVLRRLLERGLVLVLDLLARRAPELALFIDSYGMADEASAGLLESLGKQPRGWPMPIIVAMRYGARPSLNPAAVIHVHHLSDQHAGWLLSQWVDSSTLPSTLRAELIRRSSGVPLYLEEMVHALADRGVLAWDQSGKFKVIKDADLSVDVPSSVRAAMIARVDHLSHEVRDALCQCAVQGTEFDLSVAEGVRSELTKSSAQTPASAVLLELERYGFVVPLREGTGRWGFRQPLMREVCYELSLHSRRRLVHGAVAKSLQRLAGGAEAVSPELLAHHFEQAEAWRDAAEANLRAAARAGELYLNAEALRWLERALNAVARIESPTDGDRRLAVRAHGGAAGVHLRVGAYPQAVDQAERMRSKAVTAGERAEANRLHAMASLRQGGAEEAEALLEHALSVVQEDVTAREVRARVLFDFADLCYRANRERDALQRVLEYRAVHPSDVSTIQVDMLEGRIHHAAGRFAEAHRLYLKAYEAAQRTGSLSARARASNSVGNAARDLGQYAEAQEHFEKALKIWDIMGDVEGVAGARNNLGNLAMSLGDFKAAREHLQQSLAVCSAIGNVHGIVLAHANLAILAMEEGDGPHAVVAAQEALATLENSGNRLLHGLVFVVLGEAQVECGEADSARLIFQQVLEEFSEAQHPLAVAGARRGLGRVALLEKDYATAVAELEQAGAIYERLNREQEATRTQLFCAEAYWGMGDGDRARTRLEEARKRLTRIRAVRDTEKADRLLRDLPGGPSRSGR